MEKIKESYPDLDANNFKILDSKTNKEIPYQLEYLGTENIANLLMDLSLKSNEKLDLNFLNEKPGDFALKTYARYVPERLDDFAWENDKIAFRMYGKALELQEKGNAYGIDVWVKRTDRMIINERYERAEYHVDHGDGMDYYHVGLTLGAGNMAPYVNDSIWYSKNYSKWHILDNGPLRTTFQLEFDAWDVAGKKMTAIKTVSLDAGSQLNKIAVKYKYEDATLEKIPVVIGIIQRLGAGLELLDVNNGILGYWEPKHGEDGTTGVGVIVSSKVNDMQLRNDQLLAILDIPNNQEFIYYTGAVWDKAGVITTGEAWFEYLKEKKRQLEGSVLQIVSK